jgi:isoleucyl-tRNA synthetase
LEDQRAAGTLGAGLEADVTVYADGALKAALESVGEELRFVFITSGASVANAADRPAGAKQCDGFWVSVAASSAEKCVRCWHRRPDVGVIAGHETICGRCADNVDGAGEVRRYA